MTPPAFTLVGNLHNLQASQVTLLKLKSELLLLARFTVSIIGFVAS